MDKDPRVEKLLEFGEVIRPRQLFPVLEEKAAYLIEENPFAFALAAALDRGTKAEIIWTLPYYLEKEIGDLSPDILANKSLDELERIFRSFPKKPRYITDAPRTVKELSEIVINKYDGDVSKIWQNKTSNHVEKTFQKIHGVGPGISSMVVNLLQRCFGVQFRDAERMDVKPDTHIIRVFQRLGFISQAEENEAVKAARELHPEYPGKLDPPAWVIGKRWCSPSAPRCHDCPLNEVCPRNEDKAEMDEEKTVVPIQIAKALARLPKLPYRERGIKVDFELIKATLEILNKADENTLPQNARNLSMEDTPDGLDKRVKKELDTDLRTANIVSDELEKAGVVTITKDRSPQTGRMVKHTTLLREYTW